MSSKIGPVGEHRSVIRKIEPVYPIGEERVTGSTVVTHVTRLTCVDCNQATTDEAVLRELKCGHGSLSVRAIPPETMQENLVSRLAKREE